MGTATKTSQGVSKGTVVQQPVATGNQVPKTPQEKIKEYVKEQLEKAVEFNKRRPLVEAEAEDRISYAKTKLMRMEPFFAMLLFRMPTYMSYEIDTAATDGTVLLYNPIFIAEKQLRKDIPFILFHEIAHVFWKHCHRGPIKSVNAKVIFERLNDLKKAGKKDVLLEAEAGRMKHILQEWNKATDYVINHHGKEEANIPVTDQLIKDLLYDKQFANMTSEAVYDKIKTDYDPDAKDNSLDLGIGGILPAGFGDLSEDEQKHLESEFNQDVEAAAAACKRAGTLPAGVEEIIDSLYKTETPWQDVFRTIFTSIAKQDYTWQYPNKRFSQHMMDYGVVMPSLWGEEYTNAGFIMDTSGSVGPREKQILASQLRDILEDYNIKLHVLYCDTDAYTEDVQVFTREDIQNGQLKLDVKGGGGTQMKPAFDYFREQADDLDLQVVICMTDMELWDWGKLGPQPSFSVFWAALPNSREVEPDFGTVINIQIVGDD